MTGFLPLGAAAQNFDYHSFEAMFDEPVTISATGKPQRVSETPAIMDILTAEDIRRSGARDLVGLLRGLPGILSYRGYNGSASFSMGSILLNGREIYLGGIGESFIAAIPVELEEIRQIEVVRGPQSALYGFAAGKGVINIVTFNPVSDDVNLLRGRVGSDGIREAAAIATAHLPGDIGMRFSAAMGHAHDEGEIAPSRQVPPTNPDRRQFSAIFGREGEAGDYANFELSHSDVATRTLAAETPTFFAARIQTDAAKADYAAESPIGRVSAQLYYDYQHVPNAYMQTLSGLNIHDHTVDARINDLFKPGPDDSFRLEAEMRREQIHTSISVGPINTNLFAVSGMWDHRLTDNLSLVNALRYGNSSTRQNAGDNPGFQNFVRGIHAVADNSALNYRFSPDDSFRAAFSRGIDLPQQLSIDQLGIGTTNAKKTSLATAPRFNADQDSEIRISWDHNFRAQGITWRTALFDRKSSNEISLQPLQLLAGLSPACVKPTPATRAACLLLKREGVIGGVERGGETQLDHKAAGGLQWSLSYSLEAMRPHPTTNAQNRVPALAADETFHKISAMAGYEWGDFSFDVRLLYTSPVQSLSLASLAPPQVQIVTSADTVLVAPHFAWTLRKDVSLDLAADNLWSYRDNWMQSVRPTYFMTLTWRY